MHHQDFLAHFTRGFEDGFLQYSINTLTEPQFISIHELSSLTFPSDANVYFGPAIRKTPGSKKEDVLGTSVLWVDVDDTSKNNLRTLFKPSIIVNSGHGYHLYWILDTPCLEPNRFETWNKSLARTTTRGDEGTWNSNRVLRIPGTLNTKDPPARVSVLVSQGNSYSSETFEPLAQLNGKALHKIITGDKRGYKSRSERDWSVVTALLAAGYDDEIITSIFEEHAIGDKYKEVGGAYLKHTIEQARETPKTNLVDAPTQTILEKEDGYYMPGRRGDRRISTFLFEPKVLIDGEKFQATDALGGTVKASGYEWDAVTFTRDAFTSVRGLDKESPKMAWQWLGYDGDLRLLLPYLMEKLQTKEGGFPRIVGTQTLGLFELEGSWYFVGDDTVIGADEVWTGQSGPISWVPTRKEHPEMNLGPTDRKYIDAFKKIGWPLLQQVNAEHAVLTFLGWYSAALMKPWLETQGYRFPVLNVTGMRGSGKTTLIQRVFMPLFGQKEPKSYDAGTTRFVTLALLGSSNAVPIAFSEFRYSAVEKFLRFVLLSYDTGHDPRGRADQSTVDYPLSAPFSLDGEDLVVDPAAQQRLNVVRLAPGLVEEGAPAHRAFAELYGHLGDFEYFASAYIQHLLGAIKRGVLGSLLNEADKRVKETFSMKMPDRVRRNHVVNYFGTLAFTRAIGAEDPDPIYLETSIKAVFDIDTGRARTLADEFVEDVVNQCVQTVPKFAWEYDKDAGHIWFQLSTAHNWWLGIRRARGRGALERDAISDQLSNSVYYIGRVIKNQTFMYGVDLHKAQEIGLDVPTELGGTVQFILRS